MFSPLLYVPYMPKVQVCLLGSVLSNLCSPSDPHLKSTNYYVQMEFLDSVVEDLEVYASGGQGGTVVVFI